MNKQFLLTKQAIENLFEVVRRVKVLMDTAKERGEIQHRSMRKHTDIQQETTLNCTTKFFSHWTGD